MEPLKYMEQQYMEQHKNSEANYEEISISTIDKNDNKHRE